MAGNRHFGMEPEQWPAKQGIEPDFTKWRAAAATRQTCSIPTRRTSTRGRDGVRKFWEEYRRAFREVRSEFTAALFADGGASLEWASEWMLANGSPIAYRGVSILDVDGDRVRRFRTSYDSAAFVAAPASAGA
jgi:hypothetical protein